MSALVPPSASPPSASPPSASLGASGHSLRLPGPIDVIDRALFLARSLPMPQLLRAFVAAALPAFAVVLVYVVERVEGVRGLRPLLALMLVCALLARVVLLLPVARASAAALGVRDARGAALVDVLRTATIPLFGVWCWAWPLIGFAKIAPWSLLFVLPLLALRALGAPSWLTRVACADGGGLAAYRRAFRDVDGVRGVYVVSELLSLLGALGLFANLFALSSLALLLGHSMLGLDVAFTSAFMSPDNPFVLLMVGAVTFVCMEPLRVALSSLAYVDGFTRQHGGDLQVAIDAVIASRRARTTPALRNVVMLGLCMLTAANVTRAQVNDTVNAVGEASRDEQVRERAAQILDRREFVELANTEQSSLSQWLESWLRDLKALFDTEPTLNQEDSAFTLPNPDPWWVLGGGLLLLSLVAGYVIWKREPLPDTDNATAPDTLRIDPLATPARVLDDAELLAQRGDFAAAVRALYVATIVSLDRRRLIRFEPATTNWQYQRQLQHRELRGWFTQLTRVFDHKHYGQQRTTQDDYTLCRELAERLCRDEVAR